MDRKTCKECPWAKDNTHNKNWPGYASKIESIGKIEKGRHACHMITSDIWGYKGDITDKNVCIGSLKCN